MRQDQPVAYHPSQGTTSKGGRGGSKFRAIHPSTEVSLFQRRAKCSKCGGQHVDVRPNWKEQPFMPTKLRYD